MSCAVMKNHSEAVVITSPRLPHRGGFMQRGRMSVFFHLQHGSGKTASVCNTFAVLHLSFLRHQKRHAMGPFGPERHEIRKLIHLFLGGNLEC